MASKVFLDANFLLDVTLQRKGFADASVIMQMGIDGEIELYTTPSVLHIVSYFTTKSFNSQTAKTVIGTILNDVKVIDCNHATALVALQSPINDYEDALQYYAALSHGIDYFASADADLKKSALPQLPVFTAPDLVKELQR